MGSSDYNRAVGTGLLQATYADTPPVAERRPKRRKRALLPGVGVFLDGNNKFDCTIRDITADGARIAIPKSTLYPSQFFLIDVRDRVAHAARVVWASASEVGLSFERTIALSGGIDPSLTFLKRLWLERAVR